MTWRAIFSDTRLQGRSSLARTGLRAGLSLTFPKANGKAIKRKKSTRNRWVKALVKVKAVNAFLARVGRRSLIG